MTTPQQELVASFAAARRDPRLALLEGLHPFKHASRFGASVQESVTNDLPELRRLVEELAPDLSLVGVREVDDTTWQQLAPRDTTSPLLAIAERRSWGLDDITDGHVVVLDRPRHAGNVGAAIRSAAAAGAAGVVTIGGVDPWSAAAVRGAAGLQYALPVVALPETAGLPDLERTAVALDPAGPPLGTGPVPPTTWVFGTERAGLRPELAAACDTSASVPMRAGVSSLNLAVSVGVVLYLASDHGPAGAA